MKPYNISDGEFAAHGEFAKSERPRYPTTTPYPKLISKAIVLELCKGFL
jgi:hypothetical protein